MTFTSGLKSNPAIFEISKSDLVVPRGSPPFMNSGLPCSFQGDIHYLYCLQIKSSFLQPFCDSAHFHPPGFLRWAGGWYMFSLSYEKSSYRPPSVEDTSLRYGGSARLWKDICPCQKVAEKWFQHTDTRLWKGIKCQTYSDPRIMNIVGGRRMIWGESIPLGTRAIEINSPFILHNFNMTVS